MILQINILQKVERHPDQMSLNRIQLCSDILGRCEAVIDMACLLSLGWQVLIIVLKVLDVVVWVGYNV